MAKTLEFSKWREIGIKLFGKDFNNWKFVCANCGNIQSINSMIERNPDLTPEKLQEFVYYNCEGRITDNVGCKWTLGGLFKIHQTEVITPDGNKSATFEFSTVYASFLQQGE